MYIVSVEGGNWRSESEYLVSDRDAADEEVLGWILLGYKATHRERKEGEELRND
jgi:hypothetical protein